MLLGSQEPFSPLWGRGCGICCGGGVLWLGARSDSGPGRSPHGPGRLWGLGGSGLWRCFGTSGCGGGWWRSGASWSPWRQGLQLEVHAARLGRRPVRWGSGNGKACLAPDAAAAAVDVEAEVVGLAVRAELARHIQVSSSADKVLVRLTVDSETLMSDDGAAPLRRQTDVSKGLLPALLGRIDGLWAPGC